jgi:hypothetical protein
MPSSGLLRHVVLVRADVSMERTVCIIRVIRINEAATRLAVASNRRNLRRNIIGLLLVTANVVPSSPIFLTLIMELRFTETSVITIAAMRHMPNDGILHSHRRENLLYIGSPFSTEA